MSIFSVLEKGKYIYVYGDPGMWMPHNKLLLLLSVCHFMLRKRHSHQAPHKVRTRLSGQLKQLKPFFSIPQESGLNEGQMSSGSQTPSPQPYPRAFRDLNNSSLRSLITGLFPQGAIHCVQGHLPLRERGPWHRHLPVHPPALAHPHGNRCG